MEGKEIVFLGWERNGKEIISSSEMEMGRK